ncbi:zinc finger protein 106 isoform X1 [Oryzias melastigma]|uniref:Zinc finger protein 106a n=1 Tax=Oryzias melastigma TaxID=30732 RepID=A0A3B3BNV0_ORYME|nr:zinc finger protein 106 isoform X1 [Oryzias melastigma]XP_024124693.1 zinc finger protein 106 isoform X1 [Oryzias melastigma]XP_024124698.1 zinc finger protein 106 isoform X1 [Oryzias melastigma]XP_024124707.1 zinc finger protein 106 isoform X1 [Oryzias melastigma]
MERNRKCILCETVYGSKQEMDEHMRSMLHHRELEKLKGRDCGHECRVCGVTVVSLTEYASHISSSCHKQNVDKNPGGGELSQDYFDQALVDLIQKRKDKIRKENEAAAAKAAKEEEEKRKKEEFQQKLQEAKERYRLARVWQPPLQGHRHQFSWNQNQASAERAQADQYTKKGKGATWHAQAPPNLQKWGSGDLTCEGRGGSSKTWGHGTFQRSQQNYLPWLSSGGSSHGLYGLNNINNTFRPHPQRNNGPPPFFQFPAGWFGQTPNQPQNTDKATQQHPGAWGAGSEHSSRSNCNNPVPDRGCRWSPYPVTTAHQTEAHPHAPEISKGPKTKQDKTAETGAFIPNRCEKTGGHLRKVDSAPRDESRVSGFHRDASVSNQQADGKISSAVRGGAQLKKAAGQAPSLPNPRSKAIPESSTAATQKGSQKPLPKPSTASPQTRSRRPIPESPAAAQQMGSQRPISESSTTTFQTASQRPISEPSTAVKQTASQRPNLESSAAVKQTGSRRPVSESSTTTFQMGSKRPVSEPSTAVKQTASQRPTVESSTAVKQMGAKRPVSESSTTTLQRGSQRAIPKSSPEPQEMELQKHVPESSTAGLQMGSQRPILESSPSPQQMGSQRPFSESSSTILQMGSRRPISESLIAGQQTGSQRPLLESSAAPQQMGSQTPVPAYSTTTQQTGSERPISEFSTAAWQTGSHRPILDFSPAALQTGSKKSCARGREETNSEIPAHMKETHKFCSSAKPDTSDLAGPLESAAPSSDNTPSLQSLQVSTSVLDSPRPTGSVREEEDGGRDGAVESEQSLNPDASKSSEAASNTPHSSKLDLPHVLKWELSKHINSKNKAGGHEPNLNIARRVRNLSGSRKHEADRDSGLKPTVRQLLNSSGSRRCVNWEQLYDTLRKKQDKGKGMPRFGIEMVPNEQDCPRQEEEALLEGFDWDLVTDFSSQGPTRKRSLSESSLAPSSFSLSDPHASEEPLRGSEQLSATAPPQQHPAAHKQPDTLMSASVKVLQRSESVGGDSSSGMEQCDAQGSGKRRRAATDGQSAEASCLEHNSKRRKVKSKKERQQVDQLLSVSLREEELSRSLQTLDSNLIQARSTLEAAFMEVQRLTLLKQQITAEMSMLRNTRIDLLKGMQGTSEELSPLKVKEEKSDTPLADSAAPVLHPPAGGVSPPTPSLQTISVVIKAEPQSPVMVSQQDLEDQGAPFVPLQDTAPAARPESSSEDSSGCRDQAASSVLIQGIHASTNTIPPSTIKLSPSRRGSAEGAAADCPSALNTPPHPPELKSGARVRKLKKRKSLKKGAAGAKQPESSDSEGDEETCKPRWLRLRRRASAGSQSSSCSLPADDREGSRALKLMLPVLKLQKINAKLYKQLCRTAEQENPDSVENMEVSTACHTQPPALPPHPSILSPEPQSLACSQVSSTSDMDLCKSSESDLPFSIVYPKNSSEGSSDHGGDEGPTEGAFDGHQEAVNSLEIHDGLLYTCSGDRTVRVFDLVSRQCVAVMEGHASKVTCLVVSAAPSLPRRLYSGSSDQTIRCYSLKTRELEQQFVLSDRVLCLHRRWKMLYAGLANGSVVTFNLKTNTQMDVWDCHGPRGVSCLATSQEGACRLLLVGSYDSTISVRDAGSGLLFRTLLGHAKSVLCMQVVRDLVFSGSSDHCVRAHSIHTGQLLQVYRGHSHAVTVVSILGGVMVTACLDKLVRVFDLQSQEQRQVYGGHRDMVLCMNVYKNMIYTGCYDGSVHAVRLNLSHSYTCRWQGCALAFGVMEHLQQHLISVHARAGGGVQTVRCRWNDCEDVVCVRSSTQTLLLHMHKHAEEGMDVQP